MGRPINRNPNHKLNLGLWIVLQRLNSGGQLIGNEKDKIGGCSILVGGDEKTIAELVDFRWPPRLAVLQSKNIPREFGRRSLEGGEDRCSLWEE